MGEEITTTVEEGFLIAVRHRLHRYRAKARLKMAVPNTQMDPICWEATMVAIETSLEIVEQEWRKAFAEPLETQEDH